MSRFSSPGVRADKVAAVGAITRADGRCRAGDTTRAGSRDTHSRVFELCCGQPVVALAEQIADPGCLPAVGELAQPPPRRSPSRGRSGLELRMMPNCTSGFSPVIADRALPPVTRRNRPGSGGHHRPDTLLHPNPGGPWRGYPT